MELSDKEVTYVARLARLALTGEEKARFKEQLGKVLTYMEELKKIDTSGVEPTAHVLGLTGVFREDKARRFERVEAILANAPERQENFFKVRKVIE